MKNSVMKILSQGIGYCAKCGDTQGPWGWYQGVWLCEDCGEKADEGEQKMQGDGRAPGEESQNIVQGWHS